MSPHFKRSEFKCKCGQCDHEAVDHELIVVLEDLRTWFDEAVTISSGNRCPDHNDAVGGAPNSKHLYSLAADVWVKNVTPAQVYEYLDKKYPNKYGIGLYNAWVHIDVRDQRARW